MLALVLSLAVTQLGVGQHPSIDSQRGTTRVRAGIAATGGVFLVQAGGWAPGFGAVAELGAVLDDQLSLSIRPQLFTNIGFWLLGLTRASIGRWANGSPSAAAWPSRCHLGSIPAPR